MQLSVGLRNFARPGEDDWSGLLERAELLDRMGVDRLVVSDHVVLGQDLSAYGDPAAGGLAGGRQPTGPDGHWLEPLTVLSFVAARTDRIRLGTNILLAALRRPVVLAKTAATLDVLSGGRFDLGVGVGWQEAEYRAAGLDFRTRGTLLDESLAACRSYWSGEPVLVGEPPVTVRCSPVPPGPGGLPVWVSGSVNRRVVERTARFGSGWIPWGAALGDLASAVPEFRQQLDAEIDRLRSAGESTGLSSAADLGVVAATRVEVPSSGADVGRVVGRALLDVQPALDVGVSDVRVSLPVAGDWVPDIVDALRSGLVDRTSG
ncbi:MAG: TIGR03619 family F420-dependent LLM class oxidoreductase [Acidobacteria bacterium]|nr:TIGR03619 family F420-dependent LLM class oxidoreductase [Acidobacteriota bacterium]